MSFAQFARAHGLLIRDLSASNRIKRCCTERHPNTKNGAYLYTGERGWVQDWTTGDPVRWWQDKDAKPWSAEEKKEWIDRQRVAERLREQRYQEAAEMARDMLGSCVISMHPYFRSKQLPDVEGMVRDETLMIPMRGCESRNLVGLQTIAWSDKTEKFEKKFIPGMRAKGAVYQIGSGSEIILCEGYATALSIHAAVKRLALNLSVMCCFSASNMVGVARKKGSFVMADNDQSKTGELAAEATGLPWLMPDNVGDDWNDVHANYGLMNVCRAVIELRRTRAVG